jgi:hypothetical protein
MPLTGGVVQVHAAAAVLPPQRSSTELEQLLAAARAATVQDARAEQHASKAENSVCRFITDLCARCNTPVDTVRFALASAAHRHSVNSHLKHLALQA